MQLLPDASEEEKIYTTVQKQKNHMMNLKREKSQISEVAAQTQKNKLENEDENSF